MKSPKQFFTCEDVIGSLKELIRISGGQKRAAQALGFSSSYVNDVLHGRREISSEFAAALGFARHVVFTEET